MALIVNGVTITKAPGPAFSAYKSSVTSNYGSGSHTTIVFDAEYFDTNSLYNASNGQFKATTATAGRWLFGYSVQAEFAGSGAERDQNYLMLLHQDADASTVDNKWRNAHELTGDYHEGHGASQSIIVDMQNDDTMQVQYYHNSGSSNGYIGGGAHGNRTAMFWGYKIAE
tara:strand:+ start:297 stop:806 length:510 start_codon:yes stop_codon:yes gene_type:complete